MRAKNREINIFNISLLDVLTGMLGAFLFLMLGLVPYYSKQISGVTISEEEKRKFDELKKLLEKGLKGPLTPEEVAQLQAELNRLQTENEQLQAQNQQLQAQNNQLQNDLDQTKQQLDQTVQDRDFWKSQTGTLTISTAWDSADVDIDVMVLTPKGEIYSPKEEMLFGQKTIIDGDDSHSRGYKVPNEGLVAFLDAPGDYIVFYRVPKNASPAGYANLHGQFVYQQTAERGRGYITQSDLLASNADKAKPGGLYFWVALTYDPASYRIKFHEGAPVKLPPGILMPQ